ncbi:MAG TPA: asparagine synthase-related protein [Paucimonas sp.]|nr:asparagine synthase-related protein [Paucimonas sp.]
MKVLRMHLAGKGWTRSDKHGLHLRGTLFAGTAARRSPQEVAGLLPDADGSLTAWRAALAACNGFFALVRQAGPQLIAVVDHVRGFPLFYGENAGTVFLSDDAEWVRRELGEQTMDPVARDEFRLTGYVTGGDTLYPKIRQLQAGELLAIDLVRSGSAILAYRYFRYWHAEPAAWDEPGMRRGFDAAVLAAAQRLIDYADGRQIVLPLSGGYDSRLIATLLCRLGYRKVLAFTYGVKGNKEAAYSRQVAHALGLEWHFVEYGDARWRAAWNTEERRHYQRWASGWSSLPHVQDWAAVRALRGAGVVDADCVFAPGHTCVRRHTGVTVEDIAGDAGPRAPASLELLVEKILRGHYTRSTGKSGPRADFPRWKARVADRLERSRIASPLELADAHEKWEWQERQTKFICNSVRVYEFFGCDWWLPLWDAEFMRYWQGVPLALRIERRWYDDHVRRLYAEQTRDGAAAALRNAEEIGPLGKAIRLAVAKFPPGVKNYLKSIRHAVLPARYTDGYVVSHLPRAELKRLSDEGYRIDGILVHEFLGLAP